MKFLPGLDRFFATRFSTNIGVVNLHFYDILQLCTFHYQDMAVSGISPDNSQIIPVTQTLYDIIVKVIPINLQTSLFMYCPKGESEDLKLYFLQVDYLTCYLS